MFGKRRRTSITVALCVTWPLLLGVAGCGSTGAPSSTPSATPSVPREFAPAEDDGRTFMPDRFFRPPSTLDGTDEVGPIGRVIAVMQGEGGLVGVSAVTGEYRYLDLPGLLPYGYALAPDGRHLAYWITGKILGEPYANDGDTDEPPTDPDPLPVGYAVYDTVTGKVSTRELFETQHGLHTYDMTWADDDTLALNFAHFPEGGLPTNDTPFAGPFRLFIRDLDADSAREAKGREGVENTLVSSNGHGMLVLYGDRRGSFFRVVDTDDGDRSRLLEMTVELGAVVPRLAPDGRTVGEVTAEETADEDLFESFAVVGQIGSSDTVELRRVPQFAVESHMIGWLDNEHALVSTEWADQQSRVLIVDVHTGEYEVLTRGTPTFALGLMDSPRVPAERP